MRKVVLILCVACLSIFSTYSAIAAAKNVFKGIWEYKVPDAPYEYSTGKIVFAESENGLQTITIHFADGTEVKAKEIKIENDVFSFTTEVGYNEVKVNGKLSGGKISGKIDTPEGEMDITAVQKQ